MEGGLQLGSRMSRCSATPCLAQEPATLTQFQLNRDQELICFAPSSAAKSCSHHTCTDGDIYYGNGWYSTVQP